MLILMLATIFAFHLQIYYRLLLTLDSYYADAADIMLAPYMRRADAVDSAALAYMLIDYAAMMLVTLRFIDAADTPLPRHTPERYFRAAMPPPMLRH